MWDPQSTPAPPSPHLDDDPPHYSTVAYIDSGAMHMNMQTEKSLHYGVTSVVNPSARWRYEMADTFANHYETASNFELPEHSYKVPTQSVSSYNI